MAIYLAAVCHDIKSNTLEATWIDETLDAAGKVIKLERIKCRNYSPEQKADFLTDTGIAGDKYVLMANW